MDTSTDFADISLASPQNTTNLKLKLAHIGINKFNSTPEIETDRMRLNLLLLNEQNESSEEPTLRALIKDKGLRAYPYEEVLQMTQKN